jgi:hypothetical protein
MGTLTTSLRQKACALTIFFYDLERVGVDMKRVIEIHHHPASVNDLPLLDGSDLGDGIDPFRIKRHAVYRETVTIHVHHSVSEHQLAVSDRPKVHLSSAQGKCISF